MKNIALALFLFLNSCIYSLAQQTSRTSNNSISTWEVSDKTGSTKLTIKGELHLSDDDQRIESLSKNGSISYQKKSDRLEVSADANGKPIYRINKKEKSVLNDQDNLLLNEAIQTMISRGVNAAERTKRIYAKQGTTGVLNELPKLDGDYARQKYLSTLLTLGIDKSDMSKILTASSTHLKSDYYNAELLADVMHSYLSDEATSKAYLQVVQNMSADYYQYTTLQKLMKGSLNVSQAASVVEIVKTMKSDYYQAEVYKELLKQEAFDGTAFNETLELVFAMHSDYYKTEIIKNLLKRALKEKDWTQLISYAQRIDSEYYQSELLLNIADKMPQNENLKKSILEAAKTVKSEYYYGKVMRKIAAS